MAACENPFKTREPEPPEGTSNRWIPPFSAELVLDNLENALTDRNVENYIRTFSDSSRSGRSFEFIPDPAVANINPGLFSDWELDRERDYFSQLRAALPADSICILQLDSLQTNTFGDSAIFLQAYDLIVRHRRQNIGVPGRVSGELRFWMSRDQFGEWSVHRWADFSTGDSPTWSTLKAAFVQ